MNCRFRQRRSLFVRAVSLLIPVSGLSLFSAVAAPPAAKPPAKPVPGRPGVYRLDPKVYLPTSQLHAGMKGYGLTVFRGDKIERFDVNILGVLKKVNNGRDLILVKVGGNPNLDRVSDIIAGMSGSPVYVNGRIVGAVAYGSAFTKERIGYLTPIEDMLDAWDPAIPQYPDGFSPRDRDRTPVTSRLANPVTIDGTSFTEVQHLPFGESASVPENSGTLILRPLAMPVSVSGVPAARWAKVASELGKLGLDARQGIGGGAASPAGNGPKLTSSPLQPGGSIAMSLATGDLDITGVGTLTFRADKRIVAFGHPFLSIGPIDAPMSTVHIFDILPSYNTSSKIGVAVTQVGAFSQDRPFSIAGTIGKQPAMVPIQVRITDRSVGKSRIFRANVVRHPALTRQLAIMAAGTAISEVHGQPGDSMATVRTTVVADEVGTITRTNRVYSPSAIEEASIDDLASLMGLLSGNPFYPLPIRSVTMDVSIESGRQTAQIERVFVSQTRYEPGETVDVNVVLRPYKKERIVKTIPVRIPPTVPNNTVLSISVQGGASSGSGFSLGIGSDGGLVVTRGGSGDYSSAVNIRQIVRRYLERDRNDALVARMALPSSAISIQGEKLSGLPPNIEQALRGGTGNAGSRSSGARLERDEVKESAATDYVLSGSQSIAIRVARRGAPDTSIPIPPPVPPQLTPSADSMPSIPASPPGASSLPDFETDGNSASVALTPVAMRSLIPLSTLAPTKTSVSEIVVTVPPAPTAPPKPVLLGLLSPSPSLVSPVSSVAAKPVGRLPSVWRQASATDFRAAASLEGVTISSNGEVRLAPRLTKITSSVADPYYWALAPAPNNSVYAGSGDNGVIYQISSDGKQSVFARTGTLEVHSLVTGPDGAVYAGTSPDGVLLRIAPGSGGKAVRLLKAEEKYVLALALSPDGKNLYAGTGGPKARVYRVSADGNGKPEVIYESAEGSVTALTVAPDGTVYAGTAPSGLVVKVTGPKTSRPLPLYDAVESSITGLAVGGDGIVYAATMGTGRGSLYRIDPDTGAASILYDHAPGGYLTGLERGKDDTLYTASGGTLIAVDPVSGDTRTYEAPSGADVQILSVLNSPTDDGVWVSTGNTAEVYRLAVSGEASKASGQLVSRVFDARGTAKWGTIRFTAASPVGASVTLQTRTGDVTQPDETWSSWSPNYRAGNGETITSPPGRYLQYRATLTGDVSGKEAPALRSVEAFYLTPNQAPQLTLVSPQGGEVWRGSQTLRWLASDPDRDTLYYTVSLSGDGGTTWQPVGGLQSAVPGTPQIAAAGTPASVPGRAALAAELARHPEIPAEMRARMLADAPPDRPGISAPRIVRLPTGSSTVSAPTRSTSLTLNTESYPDGTYLIRVLASDKPSNPVDALTAEKTSGEIRIVNRLPTLIVFQSVLKRGGDGAVTLEGSALQTGAAIRAVQFRVDSGDWTAAIATDGLFDSTAESFTLTTPALAKGSAHSLEVQAQDEAGNTATQTIRI